MTNKAPSNDKNAKKNPAARELEKDVAKLTSSTGRSDAHKDDGEPPLAGQASG